MQTNSEGNFEDKELPSGAAGDAGNSRSLGWDIGGPLGFDMGPKGEAADAAFDLEGFQSPSSSLSLDDLEGDAGPEAPSTDADSTLAGGAEGVEPHPTLNADQGKRRRKRIILTVSLAACIVITSAIAVPVHKAMQPKKPALLGKKNVRQTLVIPELQEEMEFLVLAASDQGKNLLSIRLGFVFSASNAFERFSEQTNLYREAVYQYLLRARPSRNSQKLWQGILEKQLTEHLKQTFPGSGLQKIRVAHWERL